MTHSIPMHDLVYAPLMAAATAALAQDPSGIVER